MKCSFVPPVLKALLFLLFICWFYKTSYSKLHPLIISDETFQEMNPMYSSDGQFFFFLRIYRDDKGAFLKREFLYLTQKEDRIIGPNLPPYQASISIISGNRGVYSEDNDVWKFELADTGWTEPEKIDDNFDSNDLLESFLLTYLSAAG